MNKKERLELQVLCGFLCEGAHVLDDILDIIKELDAPNSELFDVYSRLDNLRDVMYSNQKELGEALSKNKKE
jgi:hypothetical protein